MGKAKDLDQFYTNPVIAKRFVDKVNEFTDLTKYDHVIEPSAGSGIIYDLLPEETRIGLDIDPKVDGIIKTDFFDYKFPKGKIAIVGNPPFGKQGKLAVEFFNQCARYADIIAFIIPRSFMKFRIQNQLDKNFGMYYNAVLPAASFIMNDKPYKVRCVAQIWMRTEIGDNLINGITQLESWDDTIPTKYLQEVDEYQIKHKCYEKPESLF